jgi:hypothetical protein
MNHREPPHLPVGVRRALHCLALVVLPALAPDGVQALPRTRPVGSGPELRSAGSAPYLPTAGALPLRFEEAAPPPDLVTKPPAAAPPVPALSPAETSVALANAAAAQPAAPLPEPTPAAVAPASAKPADSPAAQPSTPIKTPPPILPDSARPSVRPEDFLPYFQIPGSATKTPDVTLLVPVPPGAPVPASTLPPSSATYTQSK